jgi:hypothetical protein
MFLQFFGFDILYGSDKCSRGIALMAQGSGFKKDIIIGLTPCAHPFYLPQLIFLQPKIRNIQLVTRNP